jgi:hypothetical protein
MGIRPAAVGDTKDGTRRARDSGFSERAVDCFLGTVIALLSDDRNILDQFQNPMIVHMKRRIGNARKLAVSMKVEDNIERIVAGWNSREHEALWGRAGGTRRRWRWKRRSRARVDKWDLTLFGMGRMIEERAAVISRVVGRRRHSMRRTTNIHEGARGKDKVVEGRK